MRNIDGNASRCRDADPYTRAVTAWVTVYCLALAASMGAVSEGRCEEAALLVERFEEPSSVEAWEHVVGASVGDGASSLAVWDGGALRLEADDATQRWYAVSHEVPVAGAKWIRIRARMRAEGVDVSRARFKNANLYLRFPDGKVELVKYLDGTGDWTAVARRFPVPDAAKSVQVGCFLSAPGKLWFDDIQVETVPAWSVEKHGNIEYYFQAGDEPSERSITYHEESIRVLGEYLQTEVPEDIRYFKYRDLDTMEEYTARRLNAFRNGTTIHSIWPTERHELVHVLADEWGKPPHLLGEGLAVFLSGQWQGEPVREYARRLAATKDWIPLTSLLTAKQFVQKPDLVTYAIAGAFVEWVDTAYGREAIRELYSSLDVHGTAAQNRATLERVLKLSVEDAETELLRHIRGN